MLTTEITQSVTLGNTGIQVGAIGHGLMMMTGNPIPLPDEQTFAAIKAGIDALPEGAKAFLNSGEFYALDLGTANLELLCRFFAKYPEYADKTFLSVKGGMNRATHEPNVSLEYLRQSVDNIIRVLGPNKSLDLFQPARIDRNVPIEKLAADLKTLKDEGKFKCLGLSECTAETVRKINAVVHVTAVEIEVSPFSYEERTQAVIETTKELGISVIAYSPLGRGLLTGQIKSKADLPPGDYRHRFTRFQPEIAEHNQVIVEHLTSIAKVKGITVPQASIAWVRALGKDHIIPLPGSSQATRTLENLASGEISLSDEEVQGVKDLIKSHGVKGDRYMGLSEEKARLWG